MLSNIMRDKVPGVPEEEMYQQPPQISQAEIMAGGRPDGNANGARQMLGLDNERPQGFGAKQMLGLDSPQMSGGGFAQMMGMNNHNKSKFNIEESLGMGKSSKNKNNKINEMLGSPTSRSSSFDVSKYFGMGKTKSKKNNNINLGMGTFGTNKTDVQNKINNFLGMNKPKKNMRAVEPLNPLRMMGMNQGNINFNTERVGWNRMAQQKGLSMFGDYDGDRVMNILDCDPYDKNKQAGFHEMLSGIKNRFSSNKNISLKIPTEEELNELDAPVKPVPLDPYYYELEDKSGEPVYQDEAGMTNLDPVYSETTRDVYIPEATVSTEGTKEKPGFIQGTKSFLETTGLIKTEEQKELERQRAYELQKVREKAIAQAEVELERRRAREKILGSVGRSKRKPRSELQGLYEGLRAGAQPMPGRESLERSSGNNVNTLMGIKREGWYGASMLNEFRSDRSPMTGSEYYGVAQGPQGQPMQQEQSMQQVQQNPQTTTYSPFSKRPVTYVRGPYKKRVVMQQPYVLQQQSGY